jgi:hypothetical protein
MSANGRLEGRLDKDCGEPRYERVRAFANHGPACNQWTPASRSSSRRYGEGSPHRKFRRRAPRRRRHVGRRAERSSETRCQRVARYRQQTLGSSHVIIKSFRVQARAVRILCDHLLRGEENDAVTLLQGVEADIHDFARDAKAFGAKFCFRHWIVAPMESMAAEQIDRVVRVLAQEFNFDPDACVVVEHAKERVGAIACPRHWHICVREVDPVTGKILSSGFDHARHEYLARFVESEFGHAFTLGAHHLVVLARFRREGRSEIADALDQAFPDPARPRESFTSGAHQSAKRRNIDLPELSQLVQRAWRESSDRAGLETALGAQGLEIKPGAKKGVWVVESAGEFVGSLKRLAKIRNVEFNSRMEVANVTSTESTTGNGANDHVSPRIDRTAARLNEPAGRSFRQSVVAGGGQLLSEYDEPSATAGRRDGGRTQESSGASYPAGRTGDCPRAGAGDHGALISAAAVSMRDLYQRASSFCRPFANQIDEHLAHFEEEARATIAEATRRAAPSESRVDAAVALELKAKTHLDDLWVQYRALNGEIGALKRPPQRPFWERWKSLPDQGPQIRALIKKRDEIDVKIRIAEPRYCRAAATTAREKDTLARASAVASATLADTVREQKAVLSDINRTRRILHFWPSAAYWGPKFALSVGHRVEGRRRRLANPWAQDIWGLPIAGPGGLNL